MVSVDDIISSNLTITGASPSDAGVYTCTITNACGTITTNPATLTICPADFNCDGLLNPDDLSDYINAFFNIPPDPGSDFNQDGITNPDDLSDYINAFFDSGCP